MKNLFATIILLTVSVTAWACPTDEQPDRNNSKYNLEGTLGLKGYDPVSYFAEGGGEPKQGLETINTEYGEVTYHFATEENRTMFLMDPTKYEPTYGGWCAWAMANEAYADIDPKLFTLHGNRAHFFISKGAKARFDRELAAREAAADAYWKSESGEEPRL